MGKNGLFKPSLDDTEQAFIARWDVCTASQHMYISIYIHIISAKKTHSANMQCYKSTCINTVCVFCVVSSSTSIPRLYSICERMHGTESGTDMGAHKHSAFRRHKHTRDFMQRNSYARTRVWCAMPQSNQPTRKNSNNKCGFRTRNHMSIEQK